MKNKISHIVLAVTLLIILSLTLTAFGPSAVAYAADGSNAVNFDKTDVLDDLKGSALNGVPFDVADYPYDKNGKLQVLGFVEYCYSEYENLRGNYGLYLYLYNPALKDISESSNRIQMAVKYAADGTPTEYNKFDLQYCNKSVGVEANRFWKFKVVGAEHFLDIVEMTARTYYVSGVEIWSYGDKTPVEIGVKTSYTWTGFAEGYGRSSEPLSCTAEQSEGINLEVKHTSYITGMSAAGANHYNQVHTAYFAVPNYYFDNYGRLQKIFAEWYEYKLKNILVTQNKQLYDIVNAQSTYELSNMYDPASQFMIWYGRDSYITGGTTQITNYKWAYNVEPDKWVNTGGTSGEITVEENQYILPLAFYSEVSDPYEIFKFLNKYFKNAGNVDSSVLLDKIYAYSNDLGHGYVDPAEKKISNDLFYDYVDEGRIRGFQQREVDFDDTFDLNSYEGNHDWWDELKDFGLFWKPDNLGESYKNVRPIYEVTDDDLLGSDAEIAKRLLLNEKDVSDFKEYYEANKRDNHIVLFRFAVTDYTTHRAGYTTRNSDGEFIAPTFEDKTDTYICSESLFLNFDIISLTFNDDGEYRAFAVVSDPIDIVGDLEPPAPPAWADDLEEAGQKIADFFKKIGDWFKENWKWFVVGIGVVLALIAIAIFIAIIYKARGNKVTVEVRPESSTKRASRSYTKRVPGNKAGRKDGRKGG